MRKLVYYLCGVTAFLIVHSPGFAETAVPSPEAAMRAYDEFMADPPNRLDRTQPFLDFVKDSGAVHVLLNDQLLAWMYDPEIENATKAVLYAAFLGGNMQGQLAGNDTGNDDIAAMASVLRAYAAVRKQNPEFAVALLEQLAQAERDGKLATAVNDIVTSDSAADQK